VDTHADTTQRLLADDFDFGARHSDGSLDIPRMHEGGLGAAFLAIWVPGTLTGPLAIRRARTQIEAIRRTVARHSDQLVLAATADDLLRAHGEGRIAILMGLEGGHMIASDLAVLREFAAAGVRYMTLTHVQNTEWADASTDQPVHHGLSNFGKQVIAEMNRLGMAVDISHASDQTISDVLAATRAPIFASHSSCRALCNSPRNLSDAMMRALADCGGVVQINFHVGFLSQEFRDAERARPDLDKQISTHAKNQCGENEACKILESGKMVRELVAQGQLPRVEWTRIIEHIDRAVKVAGVDHVGLGSDFDGACMPFGMEDASCLPRITDALLEKGYSESDIQKILGGNTLRFFRDVEAAAEHMKGTTV
jgi:membrane dipeptidase